MPSKIRRLSYVASIALLLLLCARSDGAFQLQVTVTQGSSSESFTAIDEGAGDLAIGPSQNGYLTVVHAFVLSNGATIDLNTTIGTSKPQAPNGLTVRHMSLNTTTVQLSGASSTSPVTVLLELVDTGFESLSQHAPTAQLENTFTFNPLFTSATGTFQSFVGLDNQQELDPDTLQPVGDFETAGLQTGTGYVSSAHLNKEITSPSSLFSLMQVATIQFNGNGVVQLTGQTQVHTPEPATAILWSALSLCGFGAVVLKQRRRQRVL